MIFNPFWRGARQQHTIRSFVPGPNLNFDQTSKTLDAAPAPPFAPDFGATPGGATGTGILVRTNLSTYALRTISSGNGTAIVNGDGVSGNPAVSVANLTTAYFAANVIDTDTSLTANSDTRLATQKAVKAYVDGGAGGAGTVTNVSVVTANGVSGSVANPTTTPAITFTLGNITPVNVTASGNVTGTNLSGTNTGDQSAANPTATASDTAVNGSAATFMRSDGAPAVQKTSSSVFGLCKVDNSTITASGGVISAAGGSGALTLITETVTSGSAADVTFSSIASTYRDLEIRIRGRSAGAVVNDFIKLQFNGDTGSNYHTQTGTINNTSAGGAQNISATAITRLIDIPGASSTASYSGVGHIIIGDYKGTTFFKPVTALAGMSFSTTSSFTQAQLGGGLWLSTAAINAVKVFLSTGPFVDGTVVSLYGRT